MLPAPASISALASRKSISAAEQRVEGLERRLLGAEDGGRGGNGVASGLTAGPLRRGQHVRPKLGVEPVRELEIDPEPGD